jgi:hypothetical protein
VNYLIDFVEFLNSDTLDHNDASYESFKDILAVLSFHRIGKSSQRILEGEKKHKLTTLAKCMLHNKKVGSVVHVSLEAYVFLYLKGKMQLSQKLIAHLDIDKQNPANDDRRFLESVKECSELVNFVGRATKGGQLPSERKGAKDKLVWSWTDPIYESYKSLMGDLVEYNRTTGLAHVQGKDVFIFQDLTEEALAEYYEMKRRREGKDERMLSSQEMGESVIPVVDLRFQQYVPGSGTSGNQSLLSTATTESWVPHFN